LPLRPSSRCRAASSVCDHHRDPKFFKHRPHCHPICVLYAESFAAGFTVSGLTPANMLGVTLPLYLGEASRYCGLQAEVENGVPACLPGVLDASIASGQRHLILLLSLGLLAGRLGPEAVAALWTAPRSSCVTRTWGPFRRPISARRLASVNAPSPTPFANPWVLRRWASCAACACIARERSCSWPSPDRARSPPSPMRWVSSSTDSSRRPIRGHSASCPRKHWRGALREA